MNVLPKLQIMRTAQANAGDLVMCPFNDEMCLAMSLVDPANDGDRALAILGPDFPPKIKWPSIIPLRNETVASFGKDYTLRLPTAPKKWLHVNLGRT